LLLLIESLGKIYYCPIKANRLVDDSLTQRHYRVVSELERTFEELQKGKRIKINKFPKEYHVKLFRVPISSNRTDFVVTNDMLQNLMRATQKVGGVRWKVQEVKQTTGIERCQFKTGRIQRNHIGFAMFVWTRLKALAYQTGKTIYALKYGLLDQYLIHQLKHPIIKFA
jgi:hypothetical protein